MKRKCEREECTTRPSFNFRDKKGGRFCSEHKGETMVNVNKPTCERVGCGVRPNFNVRGQKGGRFCFDHKGDTMVNVLDKTCEHEGCDIIPYFNVRGQKGGRFCSEHKGDTMVDVVSKTCEYGGCTIRPRFNVRGLTRGKFCLTHKGDTMVNVYSKTCEYGGCRVRPHFNVGGLTRGKFCSEHKGDTMVDVMTRTCEHEECTKHPAFNFDTETRGNFCRTHKGDTMVDVVSKTCEHEECTKRHPLFNFRGKKGGRFCSEHMEVGMVDVVHPSCDVCDNRATVGLPGHQATRCRAHAVDGMKAYPRRRCDHAKCKKLALFGLNGPRKCDTHRDTDDINWVERECVECGLLEILNRTYRCNPCDPDKFNTVRLAKQNQIKRWLDAKGIVYVSCDVMIEKGECFAYRPDFVIDFGTHIVVLEVDEHQHKGYGKECDEVRMVNVYQSFGGLPVKFIRYNPDEFVVNGKKHNPSFAYRVKLLQEHLRYAAEDPAVSALSVKYMFYNDHETTPFKAVDMAVYGL